MPLTFDVAVIGGGVAGVSAAVAAQLRGARTCVIRAAPGATALMSGAWSGPLREELRTAFAAGGYDLRPARAPLVHERGQSVTADFAGSSHVGATASGDTVVCGIAGLPGFNAHTLARVWNRSAPLRAHVVHLEGTPAAGWTTAALAALLDQRPDSLFDRVRDVAAARILFPPVLGITRTAEILSGLAARDVIATEALAGPPSLPGWRLQNSIDALLNARGIPTWSGKAVLVTRSGARADAVRVGERTVTARSFVLATGKFLGGGIEATDEFREPVFGLPVWVEQLGDVFTAPDALPLTDPVRTADQPLLAAGVQTDDRQRPIGRAQEVVFENVFVAGTVRSGWTAAAARMGDCAEDGWAAGVSASA